LSIDCVWDFDNIFKSEEKWSENHTYFIFKHLFRCSDKSFTKAYTSLWEESGSSAIEQLTQFIDAFAASPLAESIDASYRLDYERWLMKRRTVKECAEAAKEYLAKRAPWLEKNIAEMAAALTDDTTTDISKTQGDRGHGSPYVYSIDGVRHNSPRSTTRQRRGIYISDGKKTIK